MTESNPFRLDKRLLRVAFERAASDYDKVALLQREVGRRLLERLELVRVTPALILDAGAGTGHGSTALARRYKEARVLALDIAHAMLVQARRHRAWFRKQRFVCGDIESLPLANRSVDMVFSNLSLQWCGDLDRVFEEFQRVLKAGGLLIFSTFGPDTLKELRASWAQVDGYNHVNAFLDMHDIGDALLRARFSGPVVDIEHFTLTYPSLGRLMRELKALGAHNVMAGRRTTLSGKGRFATLERAYERYRNSEGRLVATFEVVYGHGWAAAESPVQRPGAGVARIPLSQIRRLADSDEPPLGR